MSASVGAGMKAATDDHDRSSGNAAVSLPERRQLLSASRLQPAGTRTSDPLDPPVGERRVRSAPAA
jgi:hypothetical protein